MQWQWVDVAMYIANSDVGNSDVDNSDVANSDVATSDVATSDVVNLINYPENKLSGIRGGRVRLRDLYTIINSFFQNYLHNNYKLILHFLFFTLFYYE